MILLIDNYDSFVYNLYQLAGQINQDIKVIRNDELTIEEIEKLKPSHIILSPGPGYPKEAGVCIEVVKRFYKLVPILGVCLGHQSICEAFGGKIVPAKRLLHGKLDRIKIINTNGIFKGIGEEITVARYHSLIVERDSLPKALEIIAEDKNGEVMGVKHRDCDVYGVQFHPESILTPQGYIIMDNFLNLEGKLL